MIQKAASDPVEEPLRPHHSAASHAQQAQDPKAECGKRKSALKIYSDSSSAAEEEVSVVDSEVLSVRIQTHSPCQKIKQESTTATNTQCTGGGLFDTGPNFVFNMGGPGIRVQQFGGNRPRRRAHPHQNPDGTPAPQQSMGQAIQSLLPLLLLFLLPLLSSLFSGSGDSNPAYRFDKVKPYIQPRTSDRLKIPYWVNPAEVESYNAKKWRELDNKAEVKYVGSMNVQCERERVDRDRMVQEAQGFFYTDQAMLERARQMEMKACNRLAELGYRR